VREWGPESYRKALTAGRRQCTGKEDELGGDDRDERRCLFPVKSGTGKGILDELKKKTTNHNTPQPPAPTTKEKKGGNVHPVMSPPLPQDLRTKSVDEKDRENWGGQGSDLHSACFSGIKDRTE